MSDATVPAKLEEIAFPSPEVAECPFGFYEQLRREAPVYKLPGRDEYLVSRWQDVVYVAEHPELFGQLGNDGSPAPQGPEVSMAQTNPPGHWPKRALGLQLVSRDRLRAYEPLVRELSDALIDGFAARGRVEFVAEFASQLPILVVARILDLPREHSDSFLHWYQSSTPAAARFLPDKQRAAEARLREEARAYVRNAVLERYEQPRERDFLSEFIQANVEREGAFNLDYLTQEADLFLFAGNVTTTHMLGSMMVLLLEHPDQRAAVLADRSLARGLVEEALRLESPVQWLSRYVWQDVAIGGVDVPAGSSVVVIWASANRDDRRFECPEELRVDRADSAKHHLAFGRGIHLCLGAPLARLEGRIAFDRLLDRLPNLRSAPGADGAGQIDSLLFRAPKAVHVEFGPISPGSGLVTGGPRASPQFGS